MKKVRLYGVNGHEWSYVKMTEDEADKIGQAFLAGITFKIYIDNSGTNNPGYWSYYNTAQLAHLEILEDDNE